MTRSYYAVVWFYGRAASDTGSMRAVRQVWRFSNKKARNEFVNEWPTPCTEAGFRESVTRRDLDTSEIRGWIADGAKR